MKHNYDNNRRTSKRVCDIAGKNDAESEARKKEILSWLENHADEESIEKAKEFVNDKLNDIENDVAALNNN